MADIKISELTRVASLNNGDLVEVSQVNELAPSGYTSLSASMTDIGAKVNTGIEYTTDLADFSDKTIVGAINENKDNLDSLTSATLPYSTDPNEGTTKEKIEGLETAIGNKQSKIKVVTKTIVTDSAGNFILPDIYVNNAYPLAVITSYYCAGFVVSGNNYYGKLLTNNSPITPVATSQFSAVIIYIDI